MPTFEWNGDNSMPTFDWNGVNSMPTFDWNGVNLMNTFDRNGVNSMPTFDFGVQFWLWFYLQKKNSNILLIKQDKIIIFYPYLSNDTNHLLSVVIAQHNYVNMTHQLVPGNKWEPNFKKDPPTQHRFLHLTTDRPLYEDHLSIQPLISANMWSYMFRLGNCSL